MTILVLSHVEVDSAMTLRSLLSLCLLGAATGCVGPLQPLQPYAPLLRPLAPEPTCTDTTETTVNEHGETVRGPNAAECGIEVQVPGMGRRRS